MGAIESIAQSIATMEGWDRPSSRARRNNNPGNLRLGRGARDDKGFTVFSSDAEGWKALVDDLSAKVKKYPKFTLLQMMQRYAPRADGNEPAAYTAFIVRRLNKALATTYTATTTLQEIAG